MNKILGPVAVLFLIALIVLFALTNTQKGKKKTPVAQVSDTTGRVNPVPTTTAPAMPDKAPPVNTALNTVATAVPTGEVFNDKEEKLEEEILSVPEGKSIAADEARRKFLDRYPTKKFRLTGSKGPTFPFFGGDKLEQYKGMEVKDAVKKFFQDHPELIFDLPPKTKLVLVKISYFASTVQALLEARQAGVTMNGRKVLHFERKGQNTITALFEYTSTFYPSLGVSSCTPLSEDQIKTFVEKNMGLPEGRGKFRKLSKSYQVDKDKEATPVWYVEFIKDNPVGTAEDYYGEVSGCELAFVTYPKLLTLRPVENLQGVVNTGTPASWTGEFKGGAPGSEEDFKARFPKGRMIPTPTVAAPVEAPATKN